jgi:hypothetical protein
MFSHPLITRMPGGADYHPLRELGPVLRNQHKKPPHHGYADHGSDSTVGRLQCGTMPLMTEHHQSKITLGWFENDFVSDTMSAGTGFPRWNPGQWPRSRPPRDGIRQSALAVPAFTELKNVWDWSRGHCFAGGLKH